jgi:hypothetical protein
MLRTIALSLILVLSIGVILPFANSAHGVRQSAEIGQRRHYSHSRAWWRRYRARLRKKRAAALAHRNALLGLSQNIPLGDLSTGVLPALPNIPTRTVKATESNLRPKSTTTPLPGQMNVAVVALSRPNPAFLTSREESRMLAGMPVADLRRIVIDKMVVSGGWVTNDFVREVNGERVFVVTARTPRDASSPEKAWSFYFTESGGRIYGLTTDSAVEFADLMTTEAERFLGSLHPNRTTVTQ